MSFYCSTLVSQEMINCSRCPVEPAAAGSRVGRGNKSVKSCCSFSNGSTIQTGPLADKPTTVLKGIGTGYWFLVTHLKS